MENLKSLIEGCEELVEQFKYDDAISMLKEIFDIDPTNQDALALKATCQIDLGLLDEARNTLEMAIKNQPDSGFEKYLGLAQISDGQQGMDLLTKAEEIILKNSEFLDEITKNNILSSIACSKIEIWMTDLCMHENAERECENEVKKAFSYVSEDENWEALQCLSSLLLSQNKGEDALVSLDKSVSLWRSIPLDSVEFPSFEFRLTTSRLLVELGSMDAARIILEELTEEDDEIIEAWYLLSLCYYTLSMEGQNDEEVEDFPAHEALCNAEILLERNPNQFDLLDACKELREAIGNDFCSNNDDGNDDGNDDDLTSSSSSSSDNDDIVSE